MSITRYIAKHHSPTAVLGLTGNSLADELNLEITSNTMLVRLLLPYQRDCH